MNSENIILRGTDNPPLTNKDDVLTIEEIDGNFINIYNDLLSLCSAEDSTLIYDVDRSYDIGEYATYDGKLWLSTEVSTGVTPSNLGTEWIDAFPTILAHQKNKDTILDEGGINETTVAEIRAFIDAGLTSTTNLSLTTKTATSFKIESSTGTDVTLPQATVRDAGLLSADDKVKLENTEGINTGDQTLVSLNAEDVDNKVTDFTTINDTLYPTTQAVDTYLTAQVPNLVETFLDSNVELNTNKVTDFTTINDTLYPSVKAVDDQLDLKVTANTAITGATKTKITYDSKGLVASGADATTSDIADSTNKRYVTDANLTVIGNTSGTNTGDQIISDATISLTDITTNNFSITKHGFVPKGTNVGNFLKDDGTWGTPASGSSGGICGIANASGIYTYYATLNNAITAATSGQTVDLLTDITETGSVTITTKSGVKINGNGYTYTLNVNDATNAFTQAAADAEIINIKIIRTGRANNATGRAFYGNLGSYNLKCQNVIFENTYGGGIWVRGSVYGATVNSYGVCLENSFDNVNAYNCNFISSNSYGVYVEYSSGEIVNCNSNGSIYGIYNLFGSVYNSVGKTTSGIGIKSSRIVNSTGISSSGSGIEAVNGNNCTGISTSGVGLSGTGTYTNSTGVSTSGYGGTGGTKHNCTLISSSNYASYLENLNNCFLQSTTNVPLWVNSSKLVNSCTVICLWDNAGGHAINTTSASTGVDIRNCSLSVTNASAYCINGASSSTFKYANNSFKGSTTAVNTTNITQGISNSNDTKGNILI